jgi:phage shock protein A
MFKGFKRRLERALDALEKKGPGPTEDDIDRLLAGMRQELIEARARLKGLEEESGELERKLERVPGGSEAEAALRQKLQGVRAVLAETRAEADELTARFREAIGQRDALAIRSRTVRASEDLREGTAGSSRTFDRLAERVEDTERLTRAARELDAEMGDEEAELSPELELADRERHADELLEELKRRMGVEPEAAGGKGAEPGEGGKPAEASGEAPPAGGGTDGPAGPGSEGPESGSGG